MIPRQKSQAIPRVFKFCDLGNRMKTTEGFYSAAFILLPLDSDEFTKHDGVGYNGRCG
jgi:hypothetical protein